MSPKTRVALTFLMVVLAVVIWGVSQLPVSYDRSALGGSERVFAACLFMLAIALNLPGLVKRRKRPHHVATPDYYIHFDEGEHHPPVARPHPPGPPAHHAAHPVPAGHGHPPHGDHQYDRRH